MYKNHFMKTYLFTYGSLILDKCPVRVKPIESVFALEYRLKIKTKENSNYLFLQLENTGSATDIVSGYLAEVTDEELIDIDKYEGPSYQRKEIVVYKRDNTPVKAYVYLAK